MKGIEKIILLYYYIFQIYIINSNSINSNNNNNNNVHKNKFIFNNNNNGPIKYIPDDFFFPSQITQKNKEDGESITAVLDDCLKEYVQCRVESHLITLKVENYALTVVGLRDLFYDGGKEKNTLQISASFYLTIFRQLEYETEFMNYLSDETNKRLMLGAFASDTENIENNILNIFVTCLLKNEFHHSGNIYSATNNDNYYYDNDVEGSGRKKHQRQYHRIPEGRILELDQYVENYMKLRIKGHKIIQRVQQILDGLTHDEKERFAWLQYYIMALNGIESNGPRFIASERNRLYARKKQYNYKYEITKIHHEKQLNILNTLNSLVQEPNVEVRKELTEMQNNYFYNNKRVIYLIIAGIAFTGWLILSIRDCYASNNNELENDNRRRPKSPRKGIRSPNSPRRRGMKNKFKNS